MWGGAMCHTLRESSRPSAASEAGRGTRCGAPRERRGGVAVRRGVFDAGRGHSVVGKRVDAALLLDDLRDGLLAGLLVGDVETCGTDAVLLEVLHLLDPAGSAVDDVAFLGRAPWRTRGPCRRSPVMRMTLGSRLCVKRMPRGTDGGRCRAWHMVKDGNGGVVRMQWSVEADGARPCRASMARVKCMAENGVTHEAPRRMVRVRFVHPWRV